ncbi:MAG TPA: flagellar basal body L-ring protein FlgH, partial [Phycisphaerales bacterium]|nr:flagellar basal body L-ring protein FlgH [Phycisphaerales bacterium]
LERKDNFTARIAAEIIDVKPNGNLVLEARKAIESNGEVSTMVLSGVCRGQDITKSNTIQSSQVANLTLKVEGDGDVKDAGSKGILTRVLDTLFNF